MLDDILQASGAFEWADIALSQAGLRLDTSTGDPAELVEAYDAACAALEINANDVPALFTRGVVCQAKRWYEPALADFAAAVRLEPRFAKAWLLAGEVMGSLGMFEQAQAARAKALAIDPDVG